MKVMVTAEVLYCCRLTVTEAKKVEKYAIKHNVSLEDAVETLYDEGEIDLYQNSNESDFSTQSIDDVIQEED